MTRTDLASFMAEIRRFEREIAYGSETQLWNPLIMQMEKLTGIKGTDIASGNHDDATIPQDEAHWWIGAYVYLESNPHADMDEIIMEMT